MSVVVKNQVVPRSRYVYGVLNFFTKVYEISITQRRSGDPSGAIFYIILLSFYHESIAFKQHFCLGLATSRVAENLQNFASIIVKNQVVLRSRYV